MRKLVDRIAKSKPIRKSLAALEDKPIIVSGSMLILTITHWTATHFGILPNVWAGFYAADAGQAATVFLGTATASAVLAGFAGVVVVFGLTAQGDRFQVFRLDAGKSMQGNWTSTSLAGFCAAGLSLGAAVFAVNGPSAAAAWLFELSILMMAHGALRTIWILRKLVVIVRNDDLESRREKDARKIDRESFR